MKLLRPSAPFFLMGALLLILLGAPGAHAADRGSKGQLTLRVEGLPRGERAVVTVVGPPQAAGQRRFRRTIKKSGTSRLRGLKRGRYKVTIAPVEMRRGHGAIKRGAVAYPVKRKRKARVKGKRKGAKPVVVRYGTIRNPGVKELSPRRVLRVFGKRRQPSALLLRGGGEYRRGIILTSPPSAKLPRGLLARVVGVANGRKTKVKLRPASIYEAAPNMRFRTQLRVLSGAGASALSCGSGSSFDPFVRVSNVWTDGGWTTSRVWPFGEVETGAWLNLDFDTAVGLNMAAVAGVTCTFSLRAFTVQGFAGFIPIYGAIKPSLTGRIGAGARMRPEGSVRVELGANVGALPPSASPKVGFSSPKFRLNAEVFSEVGLDVGINSEIGIGAADAANIHATFGNGLSFRAGGGSCDWTLRLGTFSAGGKLGRWTITTPSTPPLYEHNLWQGACVPPPLPVPLNRAQISWETDADVDLYAWDESGGLTYFGDPSGIPDTELVRDIIPDAGETAHDVETFLETANPGRRYTFGVCLFRGDPTDVTMTVSPVPDPRGVPLTFPVHLASEGDGAVVATSPEGNGYSPPAGWCRSVAN